MLQSFMRKYPRLLKEVWDIDENCAFDLIFSILISNKPSYKSGGNMTVSIAWITPLSALMSAWTTLESLTVTP